MRKRRSTPWIALLLSLLPVVLSSGPIEIPNHSFESPAAAFVSIEIDAWQKTERPDDYDESGGFYWNQLTGAFRNVPAGDPRHIINCHGDQALWLFVVPGVGLFQESTPADPDDPEHPERFRTVFEPGMGYRLTVGVVGGGGGMLPGASMEIALYYRDDAGIQVTAGDITVTHDPALFTEPKALVDFTLQLPVVQPTDPWAGRGLGIRLLSAVGPGLEGGYWELDNVRLTAIAAPRLVDFATTGDELRFAVESEPGLTFEVLSAADPTLPLADWTAEGTLVNESGRGEFSTRKTVSDPRFYRARQLP